MNLIVILIVVLVAVAAGGIAYGLLIETQKKVEGPRQPRRHRRERSRQGQEERASCPGRRQASKVDAGFHQGDGKAQRAEES